MKKKQQQKQRERQFLDTLINITQKNGSANPYNTRSEDQLHILKINTVKYGTESLRYNAF